MSVTLAVQFPVYLGFFGGEGGVLLLLLCFHIIFVMSDATFSKSVKQPLITPFPGLLQG